MIQSMKRTFFHSVTAVVLMTASLTVMSQNQADVIRYSFQTIGSTARSFGVAGAFGSIGADPSCAAINPAGMARFRSSTFNISTSFFNAKNTSSYIGQELTDNKFNFNIPNLGFVVNVPGEDFEEKSPSGWVNFVVGFNVNRLNNFHRRTFFESGNKTSSITQDWAERASATKVVPDQFNRYSLELLAYNAWAIDKDTSFKDYPAYHSAYGKNAKIDVTQLGNYLTRGALNDYNFSFAGNYKHILLVGIAVGVKSVRYIQGNSFKETDNKPISQGRDIDYVILDQYQKTSGLGFNAKLGVNLAPNEYVRMGYAFHSPTVFNLKDKYTYKITSQFDFNAIDQFGDIRPNSEESIDTVTYKYKVNVPGRHVFSFGLVNKNIGFLSLDLESVNYTQGNLEGSDWPFNEENLWIKKYLNPGALNMRLGGELISDQYRFRAGYARYPSPYRSGTVPYIKDLVNHVYSVGAGIKSKTYSFDIAYVNSGYADYSVPYEFDKNSGLTSYAITNNLRSGQVVVSASFLID